MRFGDRRRWLRPSLLPLLCIAASAPAGAQEPSPSPTPTPIRIAPDEKDFEGLTSLSLGSGARAFGMGGAFLARADDATAASWNPAGLSYLRRPELSLVGARNAFDRGPEGLPASDHLVGYTPDFLAVAYPIELDAGSGAIQLSFQRVFSFRGQRTIDRIDRTINQGDLFNTKGSGGFDVLALGAGLRVTNTLRVGGTLNHWFKGYRQNRLRTTVGRPRTGPRSDRTEQDIDYDLLGWNLNLGLIWSPFEDLNLGVVRKTPFTGTLRLRRDRTDFFEPPNQPVVVTHNSGERTNIRLHFPGAVGVGVSWRLKSPLTLSADYTRTFWSEGKIRNFFILPLTPPEAPQASLSPPPESFDELLYPTLDALDQTDTQQFRFGAEYVIIRDRISWPVRLGFFTDRQYFRSANGKPPRFMGFTAGAGILAGPFLFDVAYVFEYGKYLAAAEDRDRISTESQRVFVSLIYRFGANH